MHITKKGGTVMVIAGTAVIAGVFGIHHYRPRQVDEHFATISVRYAPQNTKTGIKSLFNPNTENWKEREAGTCEISLKASAPSKYKFDITLDYPKLLNSVSIGHLSPNGVGRAASLCESAALNSFDNAEARAIKSGTYNRVDATIEGPSNITNDSEARELLANLAELKRKE